MRRMLGILWVATVAAVALLSPAARAQSGDPTGGKFALQQATAGLKGQGPLTAVLQTTEGTITCRLFDDKAPMTVANFVGLARGKRPFKDLKTGTWVKRPFFDQLTFHRVIPSFMIQGGCPLGIGTGDPGYRFDDEFAPGLSFDKGGLLAMANAGPATNGSQFFITEQPTPHLTNRHTIFGSCEPLDTVKRIARVPAGPNNRPLKPVVIKKVVIKRGAAK